MQIIGLYTGLLEESKSRPVVQVRRRMGGARGAWPSRRCRSTPGSCFPRGWRGAAHASACLCHWHPGLESPTACPHRAASLCRWAVDSRPLPPCRCPVRANTPPPWRSRRLLGRKLQREKPSDVYKPAHVHCPLTDGGYFSSPAIMKFFTKWNKSCFKAAGVMLRVEQTHLESSLKYTHVFHIHIYLHTHTHLYIYVLFCLRCKNGNIVTAYQSLYLPLSPIS